MIERTDAASSVALLEKVRSGDSEALDQLVARFLPRLRRWASRRLPRAARPALETDDIVQDTICHALKHLPAIQPNGSGAINAYLRQAVANRLMDEYRRARRQPNLQELTTQIEGQGGSPLDVAIGSEAFARYKQALDRLDLQDRKALVLRIEKGCDYDYIATALGKSGRGAARVMICRALARLAREMRHAR